MSQNIGTKRQVESIEDVVDKCDTISSKENGLLYEKKIKISAAKKYVLIPHTKNPGELGTYEIEILSDNDQLKVIEPKDFQRRYDLSKKFYFFIFSIIFLTI